jgi:acetyl-CoA carboxylase carboxyl transferase subunit alpha
MLTQYLDFEKPIVEIEMKIEELKQLSSAGRLDLKDEILKLEKKANKLKKEIFSNLTRWQKTLISRHYNRPYTLDYINKVFTDFFELHGDRHFMDDPAIIGGFARFEGKSVVVVGHQKGRTTKEKVFRNFGMPHPEGYRKALRIMKLADKFKKPIITMIDTPGAYPGIGAEERGQAEAIAKNIIGMFSLRVPIISIIIGEGGSGGALAIGVGDRILMLEYSIYSVISPEGCAAILWRDGANGELAAEALKITSEDLFEAGVIDEVIKEPLGGAHRSVDEMALNIKDAIRRNLDVVKKLPIGELLKERYEKFRKIGTFLNK